MFLLLSITGAAIACGYDCHQTVQIGRLNCVFLVSSWQHYSILIWFSIRDLRCQKSQNLAHHYTEAHFWHDICHQHIDPRTNICQHPLDNAVPQRIVSTSNVLDFLCWNCGSTEGIRRDHNRTCQPVDLTSNSFYIACLGGKSKKTFSSLSTYQNKLTLEQGQRDSGLLHTGSIQ